MSKPKLDIKVGKLSRTLAETTVPTSAQPPAKTKPKAFNEREQLAMAKALRTKRKLPEIVVPVEETAEE